MADWSRKEGVEIWAYCLMPNHVHLIAVPQTEQALRRAVGEAHRRSLRGGSTSAKTGEAACGSRRFASLVMDEPYLLAAARYVELNPVRAGLAANAAEGSNIQRSQNRCRGVYSQAGEALSSSKLPPMHAGKNRRHRKRRR